MHIVCDMDGFRGGHPPRKSRKQIYLRGLFPMSNTRLLSFRFLIGFEAAARLGSYSRAADELSSKSASRCSGAKDAASN